MMRPVLSLATNTVELIGSFEQVRLSHWIVQWRRKIFFNGGAPIYLKDTTLMSSTQQLMHNNIETVITSQSNIA